MNRWVPDESVIETAEDQANAEKERVRAAIPELSARQFWLAAKQAGVTKADLLAKVRAIHSQEDAELIELEIETTIYFKRDYPLVSELATAVGLSEVELDHLWTWAASI